MLAHCAVPARYGTVRPAHLHLCAHELPAHPVHPVRAQPPVEQAGGRGRCALHGGDHGLLCALSGGLPAGCQRLPAGHHQRRPYQCAVPDVHRQAVELCGAEGRQQGSVEADAALLAAHDPGTDQLLDHQRIRPVLCA